MHGNQSARGFRLAVAAAALLASSTVFAQNNVATPYGCACLTNTKVDAKITYRFKWGDGEWEKMSLSKGEHAWMCWKYKEVGKSPELVFQLDTDLTKGSDWKTFSIPRVKASERSCDKIGPKGHYHVGYVKDTDRKKIRIYNGKT